MKENKFPPLPNLDNVDIRSLRVFMAVVRNRGFSAASDELNLNQPAISSYMSQLESRLKLTLCQRGRGGFQLTDHGELVYASARKLFSAVETFRADVAECRGQLVGELHIGMVDVLATCQHFKLPEVIGEFGLQAPEVNIQLHKSNPKKLLKMLQEEQIHAAVMPVYKAPDSISHFSIFDEFQVMYCGKNHPLFSLRDDELTLDRLQETNYAARDYTQDWTPPPSPYLKTASLTGDIECIATLILSGNYVGYLPEHYAEYWVKAGLMKPLLIDETAYYCNLQLAYRRNDKNLAVELLVDLMKKAYGV
ncbi:LysR family transcriptional regulator [Photobacterium marinum]|nr:LysR family transcriptional regulator [Photobacterium marinum]